MRDEARLHRRAGRGNCARAKLLKRQTLGQTCRPTSISSSAEKRPLGPPDPKPTGKAKTLKTNRLTEAARPPKANKPFRINSAQSQRQSQDVV